MHTALPKPPHQKRPDDRVEHAKNRPNHTHPRSDWRQKHDGNRRYGEHQRPRRARSPIHLFPTTHFLLEHSLNLPLKFFISLRTKRLDLEQPISQLTHGRLLSTYGSNAPESPASHETGAI